MYGGLTLLLGNNRGQNNPFLGTIDLNDCYIKVNNNIWWQGKTYPIVESTAEDYDFYEDTDIYKAIKSYTKGQYYGS